MTSYSRAWYIPIGCGGPGGFMLFFSAAAPLLARRVCIMDGVEERKAPRNLVQVASANLFLHKF
jgi:hypothetical protein